MACRKRPLYAMGPPEDAFMETLAEVIHYMGVPDPPTQDVTRGADVPFPESHACTMEPRKRPRWQVFQSCSLRQTLAELGIPAAPSVDVSRMREAWRKARQAARVPIMCPEPSSTRLVDSMPDAGKANSGGLLCAESTTVHLSEMIPTTGMRKEGVQNPVVQGGVQPQQCEELKRGESKDSDALSLVKKEDFEFLEWQGHNDARMLLRRIHNETFGDEAASYQQYIGMSLGDMPPKMGLIRFLQRYKGGHSTSDFYFEHNWSEGSCSARLVVPAFSDHSYEGEACETKGQAEASAYEAFSLDDYVQYVASRLPPSIKHLRRLVRLTCYEARALVQMGIDLQRLLKMMAKQLHRGFEDLECTTAAWEDKANEECRQYFIQHYKSQNVEEREAAIGTERASPNDVQPMPPTKTKPDDSLAFKEAERIAAERKAAAKEPEKAPVPSPAPAPAPTPTPAAPVAEEEDLWEVVGGVDKGGIMVREGESTTSTQTADRLSTGAVVLLLELKGDRLHYKLKSGTGPEEGWVSIRLKGNDLVIPIVGENGPKRRPPPWKNVKQPQISYQEMTEIASKNDPGDYYGMKFPYTKDMIVQMGPEWLTQAFHKSGVLPRDNAVTKISDAKEFVGGGAGLKCTFTVEYKKDAPYLHKKLFAKLPHKPGGSDRYYVSCMWNHDRPEIVFNIFLQ
ncbi:Herc2, partial [Symbiodinium sp. CCMP2456]